MSQCSFHISQALQAPGPETRPQDMREETGGISLRGSVRVLALPPSI